MADRAVDLPKPHPDDHEDVVDWLSTARALWARGERADALVWFRRASEAAAMAGQPFRASEIGMYVTALEETFGELPGPADPPLRVREREITTPSRTEADRPLLDTLVDTNEAFGQLASEVLRSKMTSIEVDIDDDTLIEEAPAGLAAAPPEPDSAAPPAPLAKPAPASVAPRAAHEAKIIVQVASAPPVAAPPVATPAPGASTAGGSVRPGPPAARPSTVPPPSFIPPLAAPRTPEGEEITLVSANLRATALRAPTGVTVAFGTSPLATTKAPPAARVPQSGMPPPPPSFGLPPLAVPPPPPTPTGEGFGFDLRAPRDGAPAAKPPKPSSAPPPPPSASSHPGSSASSSPPGSSLTPSGSPQPSAAGAAQSPPSQRRLSRRPSQRAAREPILDPWAEDQAATSPKPIRPAPKSGQEEVVVVRARIPSMHDEDDVFTSAAPLPVALRRQAPQGPTAPLAVTPPVTVQTAIHAPSPPSPPAAPVQPGRLTNLVEISAKPALAEKAEGFSAVEGPGAAAESDAEDAAPEPAEREAAPEPAATPVSVAPPAGAAGGTGAAAKGPSVRAKLAPRPSASANASVPAPAPSATKAPSASASAPAPAPSAAKAPSVPAPAPSAAKAPSVPAPAPSATKAPSVLTSVPAPAPSATKAPSVPAPAPSATNTPSVLTSAAPAPSATNAPSVPASAAAPAPAAPKAAAASAPAPAPASAKMPSVPPPPPASTTQPVRVFAPPPAKIPASPARPATIPPPRLGAPAPEARPATVPPPPGAPAARAPAARPATVPPPPGAPAARVPAARPATVPPPRGGMLAAFAPIGVPLPSGSSGAPAASLAPNTLPSPSADPEPRAFDPGRATLPMMLEVEPPDRPVEMRSMQPTLPMPMELPRDIEALFAASAEGSFVVLHGVRLDQVDAFEGMPRAGQELLAEKAEIVQLGPDEEVSGFAAALLLAGDAVLCATIVDAAAHWARPGELLVARGTLADAIAVRVVGSAEGATVAVWSRPVLDEALAIHAPCEARARARGDRFQALAGATMGPFGEIEDDHRRALTAELSVRCLEPGAIWLEDGAPAPALALVGAGEVELYGPISEETSETVEPGALVFPELAVAGGEAPSSARAGKGGALLLLADGDVARRMSELVPDLADRLRGK